MVAVEHIDNILIDELAEQAVLGAVLIDPPCIAQLLPIVTEADFGLGRHREMFRVMRQLFEHGTPPDCVLMFEAMTREGVERFGEMAYAYMAELIDKCPTHVYALHYAEVVANLAERRRFIQTIGSSVNAVHRGDADVYQLIDATSESLRNVARARTSGTYKHIADVDDDIFGNPTPRSFFGGAFGPVDRIVGGIEPGQMIVIGARTAVGKTATLVQMLWQVASTGTPVGMVSLEMPSRSIKKRLLSHIAGVNTAALKAEQRLPTTDERERLQEAYDRLSTAPLFVDEESRRSLSSVVDRIRAMRLEQRVGIVGVDYLQLLVDNAKSDNRAQELSRISGAMKQLALELDIPIVCLAQINRAVESRNDPAPKLSDLKDSGSIEQDADVVILLHRDEQFAKAARSQFKANADQQFVRFNVAKNREGETGEAVLEYHGANVTFRPAPVLRSSR